LGAIAPSARMLREAGETVEERGPLRGVLRRLARRGITSVLVEGGAHVYGEVLKAQLWDELRLFIAPRVFGADGLSWAGGAATGDLELRSVERVGTDALLIARPASRRSRGSLG